MSELTLFSERIKKARMAKNFTQRDLAKEAGITPATLSAYESGIKNPSLNVAMGIAKACNVSVDWLCGLSESKSYNKFETYEDVFKILMSLCEMSVLKGGCRFFAELGLEDDEDTYMNTNIREIAKISFYKDSVLYKLFEEWEDVRKLYLKGTIKSDLYNAWIEQKKRELAKIEIGEDE